MAEKATKKKNAKKREARGGKPTTRQEGAGRQDAVENDQPLNALHPHLPQPHEAEATVGADAADPYAHLGSNAPITDVDKADAEPYYLDAEGKDARVEKK